jgi:hypothetical protein
MVFLKGLSLIVNIVLVGCPFKPIFSTEQKCSTAIGLIALNVLLRDKLDIKNPSISE